MVWEFLFLLCLICLNISCLCTILSPGLISWSQTLYFILTCWFSLLLTLFDLTPSWLFLHFLYAFCWCALDSLASYCLPSSPISRVSKNPVPTPYKKGEVRGRFIFRWILFTEYPIDLLLIYSVIARQISKSQMGKYPKKKDGCIFP